MSCLSAYVPKLMSVQVLGYFLHPKCCPLSSAISSLEVYKEIVAGECVFLFFLLVLSCSCALSCDITCHGVGQEIELLSWSMCFLLHGAHL